MSGLQTSPDNEILHLKESQKLLQKIAEATGEAVDSVNKFEIKTNSDKICMLTIGNNFVKDLEYTLKNLQRITIDNHKQGDDNKNLKEAIRAFSTFIYTLQLSFGNDVNKLKLEILNVLQNLGSKLNPLLDIVRENSPYSSKWPIVCILDHLYISIEKVKLRTQWENLNTTELLNVLNAILEAKLAVISIFKDKESLAARYVRISHEFVDGVLHVLEEINLDVDHYDDPIRNLILSLSTKIADSIFDLDKAIRSNYGISELTLYAQLSTLNIVPTVIKAVEILVNNSLLDPNGKIKNFVLNAILNALGNSIRFTKDCERILEN